MSRLDEGIGEVDIEPASKGSKTSSSNARQSKLRGVVLLIIVTEFCERIAYYGFAGSLVLFFQVNMGMQNSTADIQYSVWSGLCYITPLVGAYVADVYCGRYYTILGFCLIYLTGLCLVTVASLPENAYPFFVFTGLYLAALGCGGIKPNVATFGAEQFDDCCLADRQEKESYFNWFYWSINMGACISYTVIAYLCQFGAEGLGGRRWGFFIGYLISTVAMAGGIVAFLSGTRLYVGVGSKPTSKSSALEILTVGLWLSAREKIKLCFDLFFRRRTEVSSDTQKPAHCLDYASQEFGGPYLSNEVFATKLVVRLSPFVISLIPFWGIYSQMSTVFQNQGCQMNMTVNNFDIPVTALNLFDTLAIIMLVPLFEKVVYPILKLYGVHLSMLFKIGAGFVFAILSMLVAAAVEYWRMQHIPPAGLYANDYARENVSPCQEVEDYNPAQYQQYFLGQRALPPQHCFQICSLTFENQDELWLNSSCIVCDDLPQMSSLSILWQIPQFVLIGISEILASITCMEFFFRQAPESLRSLAQAMNVVSTGIGSLIVVPLVYIVNSDPGNPWITSNIDEGHLIYYFLLLGALMGLGWIYFVWIASSFVDIDKFNCSYQSIQTKEISDNSSHEISTAFFHDEVRSPLAQLETHDDGGIQMQQVRGDRDPNNDE